MLSQRQRKVKTEGPCLSQQSAQDHFFIAGAASSPGVYLEQAVCPPPRPAAPNSAASGMGSLGLNLRLSLNLREAPLAPP